MLFSIIKLQCFTLQVDLACHIEKPPERDKFTPARRLFPICNAEVHVAIESTFFSIPSYDLLRLLMSICIGSPPKQQEKESKIYNFFLRDTSSFSQAKWVQKLCESVAILLENQIHIPTPDSKFLHFRIQSWNPACELPHKHMNARKKMCADMLWKRFSIFQRDFPPSARTRPPCLDSQFRPLPCPK